MFSTLLALAQVLNVPVVDTKAVDAKVEQVRTEVMAAMPKRATTLPPAEVVAPVLGTSPAYRGADDPMPRITRTASCTIAIANGIGSCYSAWDTSPFPAGTVIRLAGAPAYSTTDAGTAGEMPITCKTFGMSVTGISFRCWQGQGALLTLGALTAGSITVLPFASSTTITVNITALPKS